MVLVTVKINVLLYCTVCLLDVGIKSTGSGSMPNSNNVPKLFYFKLLLLEMTNRSITILVSHLFLYLYLYLPSCLFASLTFL